MHASRLVLAKGQNLPLVEGPPFDLFLERETQPEIPVASLIETRRTFRDRKRMPDDVKKAGIVKMLENEIQKLRIRVLEGLFIPDPKQPRFLLGRQERRAHFHQALLHGEEIVARRLLVTKQAPAGFQGMLQPYSGIPRVALKRLVPEELKERPDDIRFMGNEGARVQVQHPDQMGGAGALVPEDENGPNHSGESYKLAVALSAQIDVQSRQLDIARTRHASFRVPQAVNSTENTLDRLEDESATWRVWLYNAALLLASPFIFGGFAVHALLDRRVRAGHAYRTGLKLPPKPRGAAVWLHAVSVGEVGSLQQLIKLILAAGRYEVYLSTTTATGFAMAERICGNRATLFYFPSDFRFVLGRFFAAIQPAAVIIAEVEIWPNFLDVARRRQVPVFLVNGRMGARERVSYRRLRWFFAPFYRMYRKILAQSEGDRVRMIEIGMPEQSIVVTKNLKSDFTYSVDANRQAAIQRFIPAGRIVVVAGSTHAPEERQILEAWRSLRCDPPFLIIAPRDIDRAEEVRQLCTVHGFIAAVFGDTVTADHPCDVLVMNTMGDLTILYQSASIAIMGGSFSPEIGGHNFLEPLYFAKPVIVGPCMRNFHELDRRYAAIGGICKIAGADQIGCALEDLIRDPVRRDELGKKGRELLMASRGGSEETYAAIFGGSG